MRAKKAEGLGTRLGRVQVAGNQLVIEENQLHQLQVIVQPVPPTIPPTPPAVSPAEPAAHNQIQVVIQPIPPPEAQALPGLQGDPGPPPPHSLAPGRLSAQNHMSLDRLKLHQE